MKAYMYLIPAICTAATAAEDTSTLIYRFTEESIRILDSIQDKESADAYAPQLKTRGNFLMGLAMSNAFAGANPSFNAHLEQRLKSGIKRIKDANFYNSRLMLAAYDESKLAELPPPSNGEKARIKARILAEFANNRNKTAHIKDKQSAEEYCIDMACTMQLLRCAHTAALVDAERDTAIQQHLEMLMQDMEALSKQLKEQQYYDSCLIKELVK